MFPGFKHIYRVRNRGSTRAFVTDIDLSVEEGADALEGTLRIHSPVAVTWAMGRRVPQDFIWTTIAVPLIISDKVLTALRREQCTGWSTYPVVVVGANGDEIMGFSGLIVTGRCGPIQRERSIQVAKQYP